MVTCNLEALKLKSFGNQVIPPQKPIAEFPVNLTFTGNALNYCLFKLFPFSATLLKLHLNHTEILTPNPTHLRSACALVRRAFFALVAGTRELKTAMLFL
jgi:hypothetical protein